MNIRNLEIGREIRASMRMKFGIRIVALVLAGASFGAGQTRLVLNSGNTLTPLAGNGRAGAIVPGTATQSPMGTPRSVTFDAGGNLFLADSRNNQVALLTPDGLVRIVAGNGQEGFSGDAGPATAASLNQPSALAIRSDGTLLIADTGNHCIRAVSASGIITTLAGTGAPGNTGDGANATAARLRSPSGLAVDSGGGILVADSGNHRIRRITPAGLIVAVAGSGKEGDEGDGGPAIAATFQHPAALLVQPSGQVLIADTGARRIRILQPDGSIAAYTTTALRRPEGMTADASGSIVVADADLQQLLQTSADGANILAGTGRQGATASGAAAATSLNTPSSAATDTGGGIAFSDRGNHQVQHLNLPALDFGSVPAGQTSAAQILLLQNGGQESLRITSLALSPAFPIISNGSCGAAPFTLSSEQQCSVSIAFHPQSQGAAKSVGLVEMAGTPPSMLLLTGTGDPPQDASISSTSLLSNGSISYAGAPVQLTATVTGTLLPSPTGSVAFMNGSTTLATIALTSGNASISTTALTQGTHTLQAVYSGDAVYASSTSAAITQTVVATPDFSLTSSASSYSGQASGTVTIALTVLPLNGTLNHPVTLTMTGLPAGATATFTPSTATLLGNPIAVSLLIKVPATLAQQRSFCPGFLFASLLLPVLFFRRRTSAALLLTLFAVSLQGCGGGFRTTTASSTTDTTHRYNCTITATTTGVLGDTLTHSIPVELDLTP